MPTIVRFYESGGPEKLQFENLPSQQPGKGEVRLRVQATGLNRAEALFLHGGSYLERPEGPSRIGIEAAGVVEAVGAEVTRDLIGKRVATLGGFPQGRNGVLGEEAVVPAVAIAEYPASLSPAQGSAVWISYLTAWGALVHVARITDKDIVIIPAASSSVGLAAIQITKDAGAVAIAATRTAEKRPELLALGADYVVVTGEEDMAKRVRDITDGRGARIIFDAVGGRYVEELAEATAQSGTIFLYGALSGQRTEYPLATGLRKGISLRGYSMAEVRGSADVLGSGQRYIRERLEDGRFSPTIAKTFPFAQAVEAYRFLESNAQIGKVVIAL